MKSDRPTTFVIHPPQGRKPGFITGHRVGLSPGARFYGVGPRVIQEDDWLVEQDLKFGDWNRAY